MQQLPLDLRLNESATLDNFCSEGNEALRDQLLLTLEGKGAPVLYVWGQRGVGRTHLLQACCHFSTARGRPCAYLPLEKRSMLSIEIFNNLESLLLICVDDVDAIAQHRAWEEAFFHLYNRACAQSSRLVISSLCPPARLPFSLPDLKSRLTAGLVYRVCDLSDHAKATTLIERAKMRGLDLPMPVARFLLSHYSRNMADLVGLLDTLDQTSLAQKRLLTIPFVKSALVGIGR